MFAHRCNFTSLMCFSHVFGQPGKKEYGLENVKVTGSAWDTNVVAASGVILSL